MSVAVGARPAAPKVPADSAGADDYACDAMDMGTSLVNPAAKLAWDDPLSIIRQLFRIACTVIMFRTGKSLD